MIGAGAPVEENGPANGKSCRSSATWMPLTPEPETLPKTSRSPPKSTRGDASESETAVGWRLVVKVRLVLALRPASLVATTRKW